MARATDYAALERMLAEPDTRRCLAFVMGEEPTLDAFISCYGTPGSGGADTPSLGAAVVDRAIRDGRILLESRETFVKAFAAAPDLITRTLADIRPDPRRASRNYFACPDNDAAYRRHAMEAFGLSDEEVI